MSYHRLKKSHLNSLPELPRLEDLNNIEPAMSYSRRSSIQGSNTSKQKKNHDYYAKKNSALHSMLHNTQKQSSRKMQPPAPLPNNRASGRRRSAV